MVHSSPDQALPKIHAIRRQKVVLDGDLAKLYGVPTFLDETVPREQA